MNIRSAQPSDAKEIIRLIKELAEYEKDPSAAIAKAVEQNRDRLLPLDRRGTHGRLENVPLERRGAAKSIVVKNDHESSLQKIIDYFNTRESRWGYTLLLKGTKHFGFYPEAQEHISMAKAQENMEQVLAQKLALPKGSLILDAGSGEGNVAINLAQKYGYKIRGVDLLDFSVEKARAKTAKLGLRDRLEFQVGDYTFLDFPDESFDGVYTMETLVHVPDPQKALKEFHRILKQNAKIVLFEYSIPSKEHFTPEQWRMANIIIDESGMNSLPYFLHGKFPEILKEVGFTNITVENVTEKILPMLRKLYVLAYIPYLFITFFGLQRKFINATSAVEFYRNVRRGDYWRYNIITAEKSDTP